MRKRRFLRFPKSLNFEFNVPQTSFEKKDDKPVEKKETKKDVKPASDQAAIKSQGKLVQRREGGMIEVFKGARGKAFVCVPDDLTKTEAIKEANGYFKTKKDLLSAKHGFVLNDELYFSNRSGGKKVWVVTKG